MTSGCRAGDSKNLPDNPGSGSITGFVAFVCATGENVTLKGTRDTSTTLDWWPSPLIGALAAAVAVVTLMGPYIGTELPPWLRMPGMFGAFALMLAAFPGIRTMCVSILNSHVGVAASVIGTVTAAALLGLAFLARRTAEAYPRLREVGELGQLWMPLSALLWSGCVGAVGLVGLMSYLVLTHVPLSADWLRSALGVFSVITVVAAVALAVLLWMDVYQLANWIGVEVWLPLTPAPASTE